MTAMPSSPPRLTRRSLLAGSAGLAASSVLARITPTTAQTAAIENFPLPLRDPESYSAYIPTASKTGPFYIYTCEFDASWAILKTFGIDAPLDDQLSRIDFDRRIEPYYVDTGNGIVIYGGDIVRQYSGDYTSNFLCRTTGTAMRSVFTSYGLRVSYVRDRARIERNLDRGIPIWIKMTVDFKDWVDATWITPENDQYRVVFSNDHAAVVIGYDDQVVVIRDLLGPTDTNWERPYEYEVDWDTFLRCWGAQSYDGLAVSAG
jgi:hypothetical protein